MIEIVTMHMNADSSSNFVALLFVNRGDPLRGRITKSHDNTKLDRLMDSTEGSEWLPACHTWSSSSCLL